MRSADAKTPTPPVHVQDLARLIMRASDRMRASFEAVCERYELTTQQARALLHLQERAPMRALADQLCCDASSVTGIADRLEALDLVRREAPETDRRVKLLALTTHGERVRAELERAVVDESPVTENLSATERETLAALLTKVVAG